MKGVGVPVTREVLAMLPKVELHVHLEGTFTPARIAALAAAAGIELPRPAERMYVTSDLATFLEALDLVCGLVRDTTTAAEQAALFGYSLGDQNVMYAEVIVNPTHWAGLPPDDLLVAVAEGFEAVHREGGPDCRLLPSLLRSQTADEATALVEQVLSIGHPRIVGLSVDGNEAAVGPRSSAKFAHAYALAGALGLGRTAHAGESSGPEGVREALDLLAVSRIDHGVRSVEDPALVRRLVHEHITLNVCVTSNCHLLYKSIDDHPLAELVDAGVPVTINTDDPETLGVTLMSELAIAVRHLRWDLARLVEAQRTAVRASFAEPEVKDALFARLDLFVGPFAE